ncbi:hypothetical protein AbraIFM66951_011892 [Aspergillus brasiliensis]|nr:hypothetical protein AbraIFM66951_011892 [Aspergillus brasiliensis]
MSGSPSLLPQPRQVPGFSGVSVSDAVSPHVNDVFQDAVEEHIPDPAEDDKPVVTTEDVLSNMRDIMLEYYNENNKGHAYVYRDKKDKCQRFKIGSTDRPQARKSQLDKQCKYEGWELIQDPALPIREYRQLERLAHAI